MTETLQHHSEAQSSLSDKDREMLAKFRNQLDTESELPSAGEETSTLVSIENADSSSNTPDNPPRMTTALQEALQTFTLDSKTAPEDAHHKALKEYRKRDNADYTDQIANLADQEKAGMSDTGRYYRTLLAREHIQTDVEAKISETASKARALGKAALLHTSALAVGMAKKGFDKVEPKITHSLEKRAKARQMKADHKEAIQMNKSFDRKRKAEHTEAIKMNKEFDKKARWEKRRERFDTLKESTLAPARKLGRLAVDTHNLGLEIIDPETAKKAKLRREQKIQRNSVYNISSLPPR